MQNVYAFTKDDEVRHSLKKGRIRPPPLILVHLPKEEGMARPREQRLGYLRGSTMDGVEVVVSVAKIGRDYKVGFADRHHLCHPSVRSIEAVKREVFLVFGIRASAFDPL